MERVGTKISMSRVSNYLDYREKEYFLSNIKSEYLNHLRTRDLTTKEVIKHVSEYIKWNNYERIQSKLNWKTPAEVRV